VRYPPVLPTTRMPQRIHRAPLKQQRPLFARTRAHARGRRRCPHPPRGSHGLGPGRGGAPVPSAARAFVKTSPCRITRPDQGRRDAAPRGTRASRRGRSRRAADASLRGRDRSLSWSGMKFIFAISYAQAIQAFVNRGENALRSDLERWEPEARAPRPQRAAGSNGRARLPELVLTCRVLLGEASLV
jgi:hypothetical protein